ncbi:alpha/beta fold hydrolase [Pandoraea anhela]|uniref:Hydrolase n=1 Tax=Pandoraea anhela TaxID=2508295 RepID=A0A5E4SCT5_9BURK|nr:alpha/beta hydrolase [Pandoraea anhela]VVD73437.1 hydrolase [Pandoraea anhela]
MPVPAPQTIDVNGYPMAYVETPAPADAVGAPLVLVHGSLCDYRYFKPNMAPLGQRRRVISVSLRHYFPEAWNGHDGVFSGEQHAEDLAAFITALGVGPVHVLGHSRGGYVALRTALLAPDTVRSLILADPGVEISGGPVQIPLDSERGNFREKALQAIEAGDIDGGLALFIDTVSGPDTWRRMVPWFKQMVRDNARTLIGQVAEPRTPLPIDALGALHAPVLLMGGAQSPAPYPDVLNALAYAMPEARRMVIQDASHGMNLANPIAFHRAVDAFLGND